MVVSCIQTAADQQEGVHCRFISLESCTFCRSLLSTISCLVQGRNWVATSCSDAFSNSYSFAFRNVLYMFNVNTLMCRAFYTWLTDSSGSCSGDVSMVGCVHAVIELLHGCYQSPMVVSPWAHMPICWGDIPSWQSGARISWTTIIYAGEELSYDPKELFGKSAKMSIRCEQSCCGHAH